MTSDQPSLFDPVGQPTGERELQSAESLVALMQLPGIGSARALRLAVGFATWDALIDASPELLRRVSGVDIDPVFRGDLPDVPMGVRLIGHFDVDFPDRLRDIPNPPAVLWMRGSLPDPAARLAIVGARQASNWALSMADSIAADASAAGVSIVSGLALGIDIAAHRGALRSGGHTVAVLGSGVDVPTPKEHQNDAEAILEAGGALLSEVPPRTPPTARTLVARNRLQSGLSFATVVVECGLKSGTMTTAKFTVEQGHRLLVPDSPEDERNELNAGSCSLVSQGISFRGQTSLAERLSSRDDLASLLRSAVT